MNKRAIERPIPLIISTFLIIIILIIFMIWLSTMSVEKQQNTVKAHVAKLEANSILAEWLYDQQEAPDTKYLANTLKEAFKKKQYTGTVECFHGFLTITCNMKLNKGEPSNCEEYEQKLAHISQKDGKKFITLLNFKGELCYE